MELIGHGDYRIGIIGHGIIGHEIMEHGDYRTWR